MKLVYVAAPFSAPTRAGVEANIARAVALGIEVAKLGAMPVIPHANTAHPDFEKVQPYEFWIRGTARLLQASDAVLLAPDWAKSLGATGEKCMAERWRMPVFRDCAELDRWLRLGVLP